MLRASELAKSAGVSLPTIKHYVNEGLLPKPVKTGKTMAYYDEECVKRIKLIKKLQREKFLPLDVIKRALDSGSAYEEQLELGRAILKSHRSATDVQPVSEGDVERRTGYPLHKIHLLAREGLIFPSKGDGGRRYDAVDCKIIEVMRRREELGVPFDYSLETVKIYRDAIKNAVKEDIHLFAKNMFGDIPTKETVRLLTDVDDLLDSFVVLFRQKMLRSYSQAAISQMNALPKNLALLSFLPVSGDELPLSPPKDPLLRILFLLLSGRYDAALAELERGPLKKKKHPHSALGIVGNLLRGNTSVAVGIAEKSIPRPTARPLDNAVAALAYIFSVGEASGFSSPMYLAKKALAYLKRIEITVEMDDLTGLFSRYIFGAISTMLPDVFDTLDVGLDALGRIETVLRTSKAKKGRLPSWFARTFDYEIAPAVEVRVNRFLAEGHLRRGDFAEVKRRIERIIEIADSNSELADWARLRRIEIL